MNDPILVVVDEMLTATAEAPGKMAKELRFAGSKINPPEPIEAAKANNSKPAAGERDVDALLPGLVLLNDDELDLDGVRLDAARILLREPR